MRSGAARFGRFAQRKARRSRAANLIFGREGSPLLGERGKGVRGRGALPGVFRQGNHVGGEPTVQPAIQARPMAGVR